MSKKYTGSIIFPTNFNVQTTDPLDDRLVVEDVQSLTDGSIEAPYQGMAVTIAGTSDIWVLLTDGIENSHNISNWRKVSGSSSMSQYSIPIMTPAQRIAALSDPSSGFKDDTDFIPIDFGDSDSDFDLMMSDDKSKFLESIDYNYGSLTGSTALHTTVEGTYRGDISSVNGTYLGIMMSVIKNLQREVTELKQALYGGIHSYINENTAKSTTLYDYNKVPTDEPLWSLDAEDGGLIEVPSSSTFNYDLDSMNSFEAPGKVDKIECPTDGQLKITGTGILHDQNNTLFSLSDSKVITYIVADGSDTGFDIEFTMVNMNDPTKADTKVVKIKDLLNGKSCARYAITFIISRKVKLAGLSTVSGNNYVYASIFNFENNEKLSEGYLKSDGTLGFNNGYTTMYTLDSDKSYTIDNIKFLNQTLYRLRFYTKYQDFSEEVIPSNPVENLNSFKYNTAHITIRSVEDEDMMKRIKDQLLPNELIWLEDERVLNIKASNGEIYPVGSVIENKDKEDTIMTAKEIAQSLIKMGIIVDATYDEKGEIVSLNDIKLNDISEFSLVNADTGKKFTFTVDPNGNLVGKDKSVMTIEDVLRSVGVTDLTIYDSHPDKNEKDIPIRNVRGFSADYFTRVYTTQSSNVPNDGTYTKNSDRVRISSFYAPLSTDKVHGCSHSFIELENTSPWDFPLEGVYLHFYNPVAIYNENEDKYSGKVYHLALDGVLKAGSTYLIRGAQHVKRMDDENCFIKVNTYDKEWYDNGELVSFEQVPVDTDASGKNILETSKVKTSYRFCLTYGLPDLKVTDKLVENAKGITPEGSSEYTISTGTFKYSAYPNLFINPRFIDGCNVSSTDLTSTVLNEWYVNGDGGTGITIGKNSMFRNMFALDPAKQAFNGWSTNDSSRVRYNKSQDIQIVSLDKEYIGYPFSDEIVPISRYTPKASFENKNVMTDKTQLDNNKPNMVTCSYGIDVYKTRCFNWISCGAFDEYVWVREKKVADSNPWERFESYTETNGVEGSRPTAFPGRVEFNSILNNAAYARIIDRFPGNDILFTSHKCILDMVSDGGVDDTKIYEYVVGRADKDGNPDMNHCSDVQTFTIYPRTWEGRVYQITDQQGFHWIEYQVWAAAAKFLNKKIDDEVEEINAGADTKVFPILINTGDMTQSGARINEWLDYYNSGKCLFNHLEQMNCVGNNDLCPINPRELGTGDDTEKSNSRFFHYFYCFEVPNDENLVVKAHSGIEGRFMPSTYYFNTKDMMFIVMNSEFTSTTCSEWFKLKSSNSKNVNIYTGIEIENNGIYDKTTTEFTPIYETIYKWLNDNKNGANRKVVVAMHEMPFTVITRSSLDKSNDKYMVSTRNHPTNGSRVGSNVNQLASSENRGIYWCSRLLEFFGCKLVIGGHKHTYALSYPIKEKYGWKTPSDENYTDSWTSKKPMGSTLEDEAGATPQYDVNWKITDTTELADYYKDDSTTFTLNSTKTPYIPKSMYDAYGDATFEAGKSGIFRCCTPKKVTDEKYDGFVTYSMCQATGYKLKSNKELPSKAQVFSKVIPMTIYKNATTDNPDGNQLYPMYSVIEIEHSGNSVSGLNVMMKRITGVFNKDGKDEFTQILYGKKSLGVDDLYCALDMDSIVEGDPTTLTPSTVGNLIKNGGKVYECVKNDDDTKSWNELNIVMYGYWTNKAKGTYLKIKY